MTSVPDLATVDPDGFVDDLDWMPYGLKEKDFVNAMESIYEFFHSVNCLQVRRGLEWIEFTVRPAAVSNIISDMCAGALAKYSNGLVENKQHNGHPDLIPFGTYPNDKVKAGSEGVEIKSTRRTVADTHGARAGWVCQFNYQVDPEPLLAERKPTAITHVYLAKVTLKDFRRNERKTERGTHTSTLHKGGLKVLRDGLVYKDTRIT